MAKRASLLLLNLPQSPTAKDKILYDELIKIYAAFEKTKALVEALSNVILLSAGETIPDNALVRIDSNGSIYRASNLNLAGRAHGFVQSGSIAGKLVKVSLGTSILPLGIPLSNAGQTCYLGSSLGIVSLIPPVASGTIVQEIGTVLPDFDLLVKISPPVVNP